MLTVKVFLFVDGEIKYNSVTIPNENIANKVKKKLKFEHDKIVEHLKILKQRGEIRSIWNATDKKNQKKLDEIVKTNREIKKSIEKIKIYYS